MEQDEDNKAHVIALLTANFPVSLWQGLQDRSKLLYMDTFMEAKSDPQINNSQRLHYLFQRRHFRMENLLQNEAGQNAIPANSELIKRNNCFFTLVQKGPVRMTQSYVRSAGGLPRPAGFRKHLAKQNAFSKQGRLDLIKGENEFTLPPEVTGLILHSPAGQSFREEHQALGAIGFYVPFSDFSGWAVELTFAEIIASYEAAVEQKDNVVPTIRTVRKTGDAE